MLSRCLPGRAVGAKCLLSLLLLVAASGAGAQIVYTYDNTTAGAIPRNNTCANGLIRTFTVPATDSFTVGNIAVGMDVTHTRRGDLRFVLVAPGGSAFTFVDNNTTDGFNNYRAMFSTNTEGALSDGSDDPAANSRFRRLVSVAGMNFYAGNSVGTWTLQMCDRRDGTDDGQFAAARLVLRDNAGTATSACGSNLSYNWGDNGEEAGFTSFSVGGVTLTETSTSGEAPGDGGTGVPSFVTRTTQTGNQFGFYTMRMDTSASETSAENATFQFSEPATWLTFQLLDVDWTNNAWEDYIRVDGFDADGNLVPKQMVLANAQLSFAGDWVEADAAAAANTTIGNVTVAFARPVRSLRVEYAQGDEPAAPNFQFIGISDFQFCAFDYGDAPTSYNVTIAGGNVTRNTMGERDLFMGTAPDGETDGSPGAAASGDGTDEDGITFPTLISAPPAVQRWQCGSYLTQPGEYCVSVNVTNGTGSLAQLVGWVDFNGDGDFNDANERSSPALAAGTAGQTDTSFATGNILTGTNTVVLRWTGVTNATSAQTYVRLRLTGDPLFFGANPAPNGQLTGGETEDHRIPPSTLPVELMYVESSLDGGRMTLRFASATENNNVGYSVREKRGDSFARISSGLLPSRSANTTDVSSYTLTVDAPASGEFFIADHDTTGRETLRGPFQVGRLYGTRPVVQTIDWHPLRQAVAADRAARAARGVIHAGAKVWVERPGFHRVTAAQLLAAGVDLAGTPAAQVAVTFRGQGVARRVFTTNGVFGTGSYVDFFVAPDYSLYTAEFPYLIKGDGIGSVDIATDARAVEEVRDAWYWATRTYSPETIYNYASPTPDPWHAARMLAFPDAPAQAAFGMTLDHVAASEFAARIAIDLIGVTNWTGAGQDHDVVLRVNGSEAGRAVFDGVRAHQLNALLPELANGNAEIVVETTGANGFAYDMVYLDKAELRYPRQPVAAQGRLFVEELNANTATGAEPEVDDDGTALMRGGFEGNDVSGGFLASGLGAGAVVAYAGDGEHWTHLGAVTTASGDTTEVPFIAGADDYWVSTVAALGDDARIEALPADESITGGNAQYLIISHSLFIDQLGDIVALQESRGLSTRVVDVAQVYQQFGDSLPEGEAIRRYLQQVAGPMGVQYVLLVGADTYDYKNYLGIGSVSFVPTLYNPVGDIFYTPTDSAYADTDGDDIPNFAIGRLPVRSLAELDALSDKIVAVQGSNPQRSALLVAGGTDGESDFSAISDGFSTRLPGSWLRTEIYVDDIGVSQANANLLAQLNSGATLVSYVGHSAPIQWSTSDQTVLTNAQVLALGNGGFSDLVVQWGCWNSYFVSPNANTMAHAFLLSPNKGAAAVIGVASLTGAEAHSALGNQLYPYLQPGARIGDALREAKTQLAVQDGLHRDILIASTLLGDPAMPIR